MSDCDGVLPMCAWLCVCVDIGVNAHTSIDNSLFVELFVIVYMSRMLINIVYSKINRFCWWEHVLGALLTRLSPKSGCLVSLVVACFATSSGRLHEPERNCLFIFCSGRSSACGWCVPCINSYMRVIELPLFVVVSVHLLQFRFGYSF